MADEIIIETTSQQVIEVGVVGPQGATGQGVPAGGTTGQVLRKASSGDYDTEWATGGGGGVSSWNDLTDKPATFPPSSHTHVAADVTDFSSAVVAAAPPTTNASLLTSGTLADARLSAAVAASLAKADSASQPGHTHVAANVTDFNAAAAAAAPVQSVAGKTGAVTLAKSDVGLGNVDNTSDANKPISTATQAALDGKAGTTSPTLTGDVTINGASTGVSGTLKVGSTTGSFASNVELNGLGIVLRNQGSTGTTTINLGTGGPTNHTLTPPAKTGTIALTNDFAAIATSGSASDLASGTVPTARLGSGVADNTTFLRGDGSWAAPTGGIGGSTGSTDNAILRADGAGGSTAQGSAFVIADNNTASPNNTVNHASIQATGGSTNVSASIVPKGTGAFSLAVPDGTVNGGNARGANAVDLQTDRAAATQIASGTASFIAGRRNQASQSFAVAFGNQNIASANSSSCLGGDANTASANFAATVGGANARADRWAILAHSGGRFSADGDAQRIRAVLRCATTTNAAVEMALDGGTAYLTIPSGKVMYGEIYVVGVRAGGADVAIYRTVYAAKNIGGTSTEVFSSVTTDAATGTSLEIATVDAGDYIRIRPTGVASQNWRWVAKVDMVEVAHG